MRTATPGWLEVAKLKCKNLNAVKEALLRWFMTFGVPSEISADGGPHSIQSATIVCALRTKQREEAPVKSAKRILRENINLVTGELNTESAVQAILSHRNTPAQKTGISPGDRTVWPSFERSPTDPKEIEAGMAEDKGRSRKGVGEAAY